MSDEFDLNGIVLIGAAFIVGYWVVGVIIARLKPKRRDTAPRESTPRQTGEQTRDTAAEREARANLDRDAESRRVLEAAQRMRDQAAVRAQEEQRRRQERDGRAT